MADIPPLFYYLQNLRRALAFDEHFEIYSEDDLTAFINQSRAEVAAQGQCIRRLSPSTGSIYTLTITNPGTGYTNPTLSITTPDAPTGLLPYPTGLQATAVAQQIGGQLSNASVVVGGGGYFQPVVTVNDPTGTGATVTAQLTPLWATNEGQEEYAFADIPLAVYPGVGPVLAILSVSFIWAGQGWQWSASRCGFAKYQAMIRQYGTQWLAPPTWCVQYGQGIDGTYRLYPVPDQPYQQLVDCICLPTDLEDDTSYEAIPRPWRVAVVPYAAHLALMAKSAEIPQLFQLSQTYYNAKDGGLFNTAMKRARAFSQPGYVSSYYSRV